VHFVVICIWLQVRPIYSPLRIFACVQNCYITERIFTLFAARYAAPYHMLILICEYRKAKGKHSLIKIVFRISFGEILALQTRERIRFFYSVALHGIHCFSASVAPTH